MYKTLVSIAFLAACSSSKVNVAQSKGVTQQQQKTADKTKQFASTTPPAKSHSMGMMTTPSAGNTTIPITNVEVYTFTASITDDGTDETLYWAYDGQTAYVWGQINLVCVDDNGDPTGETGTADFIYEANGSAYGWMAATDSCGYSSLYGCDDDGSGEVCGGCDWNSDAIVCSAD